MRGVVRTAGMNFQPTTSSRLSNAPLFGHLLPRKSVGEKAFDWCECKKEFLDAEKIE